MQCKVLKVSKNGFYNWKKKHNEKIEKKAHILIEILNVYWDSKGIYGSPRITILLNRKGIKISQKSVSKHMRLLGISSIHHRNFPKHISKMSAEERALIHNLILNLDITHPNQVWTTDITYIETIYDGRLYLISFIDQFSKRVVGWHLGRTQKACEIEIAFKKAYKLRKPSPGLICHSDKGSQFRSKLYRGSLIEHHCIFSYTELNHSCDQNSAQESFHATLKKEWLSDKKLFHYEDAYVAIFNFIEGFYNPKRLHSSLGYLSPITFEKNYEINQKNSKTPSKNRTKY